MLRRYVAAEHNLTHNAWVDDLITDLPNLQPTQVDERLRHLVDYLLWTADERGDGTLLTRTERDSAIFRDVQEKKTQCNASNNLFAKPKRRVPLSWWQVLKRHF